MRWCWYTGVPFDALAGASGVGGVPAGAGPGVQWCTSRRDVVRDDVDDGVR